MSSAPDAATSAELLQRAQAGDQVALSALIAIYLPRLRRWATGRIPPGARALLETQDVVQETLIAAVRNLRHVEVRGEGAFQAYLSRALMNRLTDLYRRNVHQPARGELPSDLPANAPSPLEQVIGSEALARYESALTRLSDTDREAIILRVEMCCGYNEIASELHKADAGQARVAVCRALARLSRQMSDGRR
jgi:RNA polymerase sigma-70 factor (ECF subfamily)